MGLNLLPPVSIPGILLVVIVGISWLVALWRLMLFLLVVWNLTGGLHLILLLGLVLTVLGGLVRSLSLCTPLWPSSWLPAVDYSGGSASVEVQRVWEIYDDRLQFMAVSDALLLEEASRVNDVSRAWLVWSRVVRLGGPKVRKARCNVADSHDAGGVFMCRDSSIAPVLDLRRWLKAVLDVLDSMVRNGVSLARSVELSVQWDRILRAGPVHLVTLDDFHAVAGAGLVTFETWL